jgi:DNA-binding transcriptional MerR regulator
MSEVEARAGSGAFLAIGQVLTLLRPEFPDVSISKIRFLESEGLVEPERSSSGYRKFSRADVARLRYVLTAQRDNYLPLRVIKAQLDAGELLPVEPSGMAGGSAGSGPQVDRPAVLSDGSDLRLDRAELCRRSGLTDAALTEFEDAGLVTGQPKGVTYDGHALQVARTVAEFGGHGIGPRHLRSFRAPAEREAGLIEQVVAPLARQRDPQARARAAATTRELTALSLRLHGQLVEAALRRSANT